MALLNLCEEGLRPPSREVQAFAEHAVQQAGHYAGDERRSEPREPIVRLVTVAPVDENLRQAGKAFRAVTRDISNNGLSLCHEEQITAKWLVVQLSEPTGQTMQIVVEVLRCRPFGPGYEVGGRIVTKLHPAHESTVI